MKKIFITGGCGYVGTMLVRRLLENNYFVQVVDTMWFGNFLKKDKNLLITKNDIRKIQDINLKGFNTVIHLASIANDPCSDLNPKLSWETSPLASQMIIESAIKNKVKQFIYASSGSIYGIKKEKNVTEDLLPKPISDYNKAKMVTERLLLSYKDQINLTILRPGTVCGYSPRMRFDTIVNLLTLQALMHKRLIIEGGKQIRPHINIHDLIEIYIYCIKNQKKMKGIYNAAFENYSIKAIAKKVQKIIDCTLQYSKNLDIRSYRQDSSKIIRKGYKPKYTVDDAIREIVKLYQNNKLKYEDRFYNLRWMIKKGYNKLS